MVACTRLGQALAHIDFVMALCSAGDMPPDVQHYHEYDAILRNTTKPVIYSAPGRRHAATLLEMAAAVSGSEDSLRRRPSMVLFTQPVSPLQIGPYSEGMIEAAALGVPVLASPGPMMGATSPATLAGTLVRVNAEALFGVVLSQLLKPGTPVILGPPLRSWTWPRASARMVVRNNPWPGPPWHSWGGSTACPPSGWEAAWR